MHFDIIIKEGVVLLSHPQDPYKLVEESVDIGISKGYITKIGFLEKTQCGICF